MSENLTLWIDNSGDGDVLDGTSTDLLSLGWNYPNPAGPTVHGSGTYTAASPGSSQVATINLSVSAGDIVMIIADFYTSNPSTAADFEVNSISGGGVSGSWTQRFAQNQASSEYSGKSLRKEVWWGLATAAATSVAVTLSAVTTTYVSVTAVSISGANTTTPFDPNSSIPAYTAVGASSNSYYHNVASVSTNNSTNFGLMIAALCQVQSSSTPTQLYPDQNSLAGEGGPGCPTLIANNPASSYMASAVEYQPMSAALSSQTVNVFGGQAAYDFIAYVDVIQAPTLGSTGSWGSTEGTDAMSCHGGLVGGAWASTEGHDVWAASGGVLGGSWHSTEVKDVFAGAGYPQLAGVWASTDTTDTFIGVPGISGSWHSTDGTDTFSCQGGLVGGSWHSTGAADTFSCQGGLVGGTWGSTEAKDQMSALGWVPATGTMAATETDDIFAWRGYLQEPEIDGSAVGGGIDVTAVNCTLTTANANDVIVVAVVNTGFFNESTSQSTITDTAGLTWNNRLAYNTTAHCFYEVWWAHAPTALSGDVITATLAHATEAASIMAFGVSGANYISPFDSHSGVPENEWGGSGAIDISTTAPNDFIFGIGYGWNINGTATCTQGTEIAHVENDGEYYDATLVAYGKTVTTAQTNLGFTFSQEGGAVGVYLDAIVGWPVGSWASTDTHDTLAITGSTLGGKLLSTENKDAMASLGWVPATATMGPTETADIMSMIGHPAVHGTWSSTEGTDFFTTSGTTTPPLSLDGYATNGTASGTTATVTLSTSLYDDIIVLCISTGGFFSHSQVASIADTAGLVWKQRNQRWCQGGRPSLEIWWAKAATPLTADVITVTMEATTGGTGITAFGVNGANTTFPWDKHTMAGWMNDGESDITCPVNTSAQKTFDIVFESGAPSGGTSSTFEPSSPYVSMGSAAFGNEHDGYSYAAWVGYNIVDEPQTNSSVSVFTGSNIFGDTTSNIMVDAIVSAEDAGTDQPVPFYFDVGSVGNIITLESNNQTLTIEGFSPVNADLVNVMTFIVESSTGEGQITGISGSITGSPGWTRRSRTTNALGTTAIEVWWCYSSTPSSGNLSATTSNTITGDTIATLNFAVGNSTHSIASTDEIWDGDSSLPMLAHSDAGGYPALTDMSTINTGVLSLLFVANTTEAETPAAPYMTFNDNGINLSFSSNAPITDLQVAYMYSSTALTNQGGEFNASPAPESWVAVGDALLVGIPQPPTGILAVTDRKDFTGGAPAQAPYDSIGWIGWVPDHGTMTATDTPDHTGGAPAQAPYDSIGWIGWVPAFATMGATDSRDRMAGYGWYSLGLGPIRGTMYPTEPKDRFAGSDYTGNGSCHGTWSSTELKDRLGSDGFPIPRINPPGPKKLRQLIIS